MPPLPRVRIRLKSIAPAQRRMRWRTASASSRCKRPMRKRYMSTIFEMQSIDIF